MAQRPARLLRQIDLAVNHLRQSGLEFPASRFDGTRLDPFKLAEVLEPLAERLGEVQADLRLVGSEMNARTEVDLHEVLAFDDLRDRSIARMVIDNL
ncbi:MAG: hypothetical protein GY719_21045 [bacterium]|nr:hypothetical protein [bacterium]